MDSNNNDLKQLLFSAREMKGYSQRKLARKIGIHHSSLNDIENGRIKKIDIEVLRKIAKELDINLDLLLKAAGYNEVVDMFEESNSFLQRKATKGLKNLLDEYRRSQMDLLDDSYQKRSVVRDCRARIRDLVMKLDDYDFYKELWTIDKIKEELEDINKELIKSAKKYDYSKLPKK